jgi:hypothetical protein
VSKGGEMNWKEKLKFADQVMAIARQEGVRIFQVMF